MTSLRLELPLERDQDELRLAGALMGLAALLASIKSSGHRALAVPWGLLVSVVGGFQRRARAQSRQEERALWLVYEVLRARADGHNAPKVAVTQVRRMLDAQWVGVVCNNAIRTSAGTAPADLDLAALPELDEDGLLRDGQTRRAVLVDSSTAGESPSGR